MWISRSGKCSAITSSRSRASSGFVAPPLTADVARTGSATGREQNGNVTTIATTTQLLPNPSLTLPAAEPS